MFVTPSRANDLRSEDGAILPLFGLLIVVLLVFAAFTVDLGAAWAERRQLQSAADAGAMAARSGARRSGNGPRRLERARG